MKGCSQLSICTFHWRRAEWIFGRFGRTSSTGGIWGSRKVSRRRSGRWECGGRDASATKVATEKIKAAGVGRVHIGGVLIGGRQYAALAAEVRVAHRRVHIYLD